MQKFSLIILFQMAFVGTTLNTAIVAFGLRYIFAELVWEEMNIFHTATFASIISGQLVLDLLKSKKT